MKPEFDFEDVSGEAHAADRRAEEIGVLRGRALEHTSIGHAHLHRRDVVTEVPISVLILSMYVGCDQAAQSHELGTR